MNKLLILILILILSLSMSCKKDDGGTPTAAAPVPTATATPACSWEANSNNPIISSNFDAIGDLIINDPSVIKEGSNYRIWFSKGNGIAVNHVKIYQGTSTDGINWTLSNDVLLEPNSDAVASGSPVPNVAGTYELIGELTENLTNDKPAFKLTGQEWYLWYDDDNLNYRISSQLDGDGTSSWLGNGGTNVDGTYSAFSGGATNNITIISDFDSEKVETPMVLKVGSTYHMYYSAFKIGDGAGQYRVGHATSPDGTNWTKDDANNPVIDYHNNALQWGWFQAAEPGVIYNPTDSKFYLYYTTAMFRGAEYNGTDYGLKQVIGVATSSDGSDFTPQQIALEQSSNYPVSEGFVGHSTPYALIDSNGLFHLFYDAANYSTGKWMQTSLGHAVSGDGLTFVELEHDIFTTASADWSNYEVRAPAVIEEDGLFKMYYAGNNDLIFQSEFEVGIGYATRDVTCQ